MPRQISLLLLAGLLLPIAGPGRAERVQAVMTVGAQVTQAGCIAASSPNPGPANPGLANPGPSCAGATTIAVAQGPSPAFAVAGEEAHDRLEIAY